MLKVTEVALSPAQVLQLIQAATKQGFDGALARVISDIAARKRAVNISQGGAIEHVP